MNLLARSLAVGLLLLACPASAQELDPLASIQGYTTADPIEPDRLGLATPDGRFAVAPLQGCDWLAEGQNVRVYTNWQMPPWLGLSAVDQDAPSCAVRVDGRMDATPCFLNTDGLCDVILEQE